MVVIKNIKRVEDLKDAWLKEIEVLCTNGKIIRGKFCDFERSGDSSDGKANIGLNRSGHSFDIYLYLDEIVQVTIL